MENKYERTAKGRDAWEGFPETYKSMLMAMYFSDGGYCIREAMRFLQENKVDKNEYSGNAKLNYLRWADRFFRELSTVFSNEGFWKENIDTLEDILCCAEGYLKDLSGDYCGITHAHRTEAGYQDDTNLVNLAQTQDFYFSLLYWHQGKEEEFRERLGNIFSATMRNVRYVVAHEDAEELTKLDFHGMDGFDSVEFIFWTPLSWLYDEDGMSDYAHELLPIYEEYVEFLTAMDGDGFNTTVRDKFLLDAETDLQHLYEISIERMTDEDLIDSKYYGDSFDEKENKLKACDDRINTIRERLFKDNIDFNLQKQTEMEHCWEEICDDLRGRITDLEYQCWIKPLVYDLTDVSDGIIYLRWDKPEEPQKRFNIIQHIKEIYQDLLDTVVHEHIPEISHVEVGFPGYYHKRWRGFTDRLKKILMDYPEMPVVVFKENDENDGNSYYSNINSTECTISYVHDPDTGEFVEKVIAIYVNKPKITEGEFMIPEDEIPF